MSTMRGLRMKFRRGFKHGPNWERHRLTLWVRERYTRPRPGAWHRRDCPDCAAGTCRPREYALVRVE